LRTNDLSFSSFGAAVVGGGGRAVVVVVVVTLEAKLKPLLLGAS
jgi:hypothetical protein